MPALSITCRDAASALAVILLRALRTFELAVELHQACEQVKLPSYLRDQLLRASSSVALNLAEGDARATRKDQLTFFNIAMGSLRECQAVLRLIGHREPALLDKADHVGASLYRLCKHDRLNPSG
jgi:four helix bundle protein